MNIDTPYFRVGLTLGVLWLLSWAYISYQSFNSDYKSLSDSVPIYVTDICDIEVFDANTNSSFRAQTEQEKSRCLYQAHLSYQEIKQSSKQFYLKAS